MNTLDEALAYTGAAMTAFTEAYWKGHKHWYLVESKWWDQDPAMEECIFCGDARWFPNRNGEGIRR